MQSSTSSLGVLTLALLGCLAACSGGGSDIGPKLGTRPPEPFVVQVFDDQTRPVSAATVRTDQATFVTGRAGRAESPVLPSGPTLLSIDAGAASASDGDQLVGLSLRGEPIDAGRSLGRAVFLPDLSASAGLLLATGVQSASVTLDDRSASGAVLAIAAGTVVSDGSQANVTLRSAGLQPYHLPAAPPGTTGFATLLTGAVFVAPVSVTFGVGASLSLPDTIGAAGSSATIDLLRFDGSTGNWTRVGAGAAVAGRIESAAPGIDRGGLYVFAASTPRTCAVSGRVVDADGKPVPRALVHVGGHALSTDANGFFALPLLPAVDLAERARTETIELIGGRGYLPVSAITYATLADGPQPLPDLTLDTRPSGHLRLLLVERGAVLPDRWLKTSQTLGDTRADTFIGADGSGILEDLAAGDYGVAFGRADDRDASLRAEGFVRLRPDERFLDVRLFSLRGSYDSRRRGNTVVVVDAEGGGPLLNVGVVRGAEPEQGFAGRTLENGSYYLGLGRDDQVTAVSDTTRSGRHVISAFTTVQTMAQRIELPVRVAARARTGAFERHGLVEGTVSGGAAGHARELRATWPLTYREWFERVMLDDQASGGRVPLKRAVSTSGPTATFTIGVPRPRGHVALAEHRLEFGRSVLDAVFVAFDLAPAEGSSQSLAGAMVHPDTEFATAVSGANSGSGIDARLSLLVADWGVQNAAGTIADVTRGTVPVGTLLMGLGMRFSLPSRTGMFDGARYLMCVRGEATSGGATVAQRQVVTLSGTSGNPAAPMLAVPALAQPAPGAVVPADGFTVEFTPPIDATFVVLRLWSDAGSELREWTVLLPATQRSFAFRRLPAEVSQVLTGARTWQLGITAYRASSGPLLEQNEPYRTIIANYVSLGPAELGVDAIASQSISISTP